MDKVLSDFLTFFTTIDPIGTLTIFVGLTARAAPKDRAKIALRAVAYAALILLLFILLGQLFLGSIGIQLASFQLAGGIIFFLFGLQMVFGSGASESNAEGQSPHDVAVFPLAVPSIASPGAILGNAGCSLVIRVMGMILCGLAVEMILAAIHELLPMAAAQG